MYYVYILFSKLKYRTYVGCTLDVEKRLREHNGGRVRSTKAYKPFSIIYKERFNSLIEARQRESFFKTTTGRRRLKDLIKDYKLNIK
ncbi:MAG: GIY-YIG nuclease family protein [Candidatus Omnitrophota bacterium]